MKSSLLDRITIEPGKCGGRPCIRGLRIRVTDILGLGWECVHVQDVGLDDLRAKLLGLRGLITMKELIQCVQHAAA